MSTTTYDRIQDEPHVSATTQTLSPNLRHDEYFVVLKVNRNTNNVVDAWRVSQQTRFARFEPIIVGRELHFPYFQPVMNILHMGLTRIDQWFEDAGDWIFRKTLWITIWAMNRGNDEEDEMEEDKIEEDEMEGDEIEEDEIKKDKI